MGKTNETPRLWQVQTVEVTNLYDTFKPNELSGTCVGWTQIKKDGADESCFWTGKGWKD